MGKRAAVLVGVASLTLLDIAAASAQPVRPYDWSGFYIGGHAGYRWTNATLSAPGLTAIPPFGTDVPPTSVNYAANGAIGGAQAGYNYMLTPMLLAGIEVDWSWGDSRQSQSNNLTVVDTLNDGFNFISNSELQVTWQSTIRGRFGVVDGPWLFYATGGVAFAHVTWTENSRADLLVLGNVFSSTSASSNASKTLTGWVAGFGTEYMFSPNWIGRAEVLYEGFGNFTVTTGALAQEGAVDLKDVAKFRVGISYKFGS